MSVDTIWHVELYKNMENTRNINHTRRKFESKLIIIEESKNAFIECHL